MKYDKEIQTQYGFIHGSFFVRPFDFSLFDFFPKIGKALFLPPFGKGLPKKSFS